MKLAQALIQRSDLKEKISEIRNRLKSNATVQDGEAPFEDPQELLKKLDIKLLGLENIIKQINLTNSKSSFDKEMSILDALAKRDVLNLKINTLKSFLIEATHKSNRYSLSEIKINSTVDAKKLQKNIDALSKEYRILDTKIQESNWTTDLI